MSESSKLAGALCQTCYGTGEAWHYEMMMEPCNGGWQTARDQSKAKPGHMGVCVSCDGKGFIARD